MLPRLIERKLIFYDFLKQIPSRKATGDRTGGVQAFQRKALAEILEKTEPEVGGRTSTLSCVRWVRRWPISSGCFSSKWSPPKRCSAKRAATTKSATMKCWPITTSTCRLFLPGQSALGTVGRRPVEICHARTSLQCAGADGERGLPRSELCGRCAAEFARSKAAEGGQYDWTTQGSLVNKEIDRLLFMLPEGQLSKVVKSDSMYQILRVIERVEAGTKPFIAVQNEIVEKIKKQRFEERVEAYRRSAPRRDLRLDQYGGDAAPPRWHNPSGELALASVLIGLLVAALQLRFLRELALPLAILPICCSRSQEFGVRASTPLRKSVALNYRPQESPDAALRLVGPLPRLHVARGLGNVFGA